MLRLQDMEGGRWEFALDSLVTARLTSSLPMGGPPDSVLRLAPVSGTSRARLVLRELEGVQQADTVAVERLEADVLLGR